MEEVKSLQDERGQGWRPARTTPDENMPHLGESKARIQIWLSDMDNLRLPKRVVTGTKTVWMPRGDHVPRGGSDQQLGSPVM